MPANFGQLVTVNKTMRWTTHEGVSERNAAAKLRQHWQHRAATASAGIPVVLAGAAAAAAGVAPGTHGHGESGLGAGGHGERWWS